MCLTETATVVAHADGETLVRIGDRQRSLPNLLVPDARPGDLVVVGMGLVLGRAPEPVDRDPSMPAHELPEAPR